jgi:hypothetical protein
MERNRFLSRRDLRKALEKYKKLPKNTQNYRKIRKTIEKYVILSRKIRKGDENYAKISNFTKDDE